MYTLSSELKAGNLQSEKLVIEIQKAIEKLKESISNAQTLILNAEIASVEYTNIKNTLKTGI